MTITFHVTIWSKETDRPLKVEVSFDHDPSSNEVRDRLRRLYPNYYWGGQARITRS